MEKYKFFTLSLFFILHSALSASLLGQSISQESEIWTQSLKQCWTYQSDNLSQINIASDNELIFIPLLNGGIEAIHSRTGKVQWNTELGGRIASNLLNNKSSIYVLNEAKITNDSKGTSTQENNSQSETFLRSIDITSGVVNWNISIPVSDFKAQLFLTEDKILLITENGNLISINPQSGETIREYKTDESISSSYIQDGTVILGTINKKLISLSLANMQSLREFSVPEVPSNVFLNGLGEIFWADSKGTLRSTSTDSGKLLWTRKFGAEISGISGISRGLLVTSLDNFLYFIGKDSGNILWKRRLAARITEKPFIRDNISILSAFGDRNAFFIELKRGKVVNMISLSDANYFVGNPVYVGNLLIFPTLRGLYAFSNDCPKK